MIQIKRVYEPPSAGDGQRLLVERLWPRGIKKENLVMHAWLKDVAPSTGLRQWFSHRLERWRDFQRRYREELAANPDIWMPILAASRKATVTLLYSARDEEHNGALVLRDYLQERGRRGVSKEARRGRTGVADIVRRRASSSKVTSRRQARRANA